MIIRKIIVGLLTLSLFLNNTSIITNGSISLVEETPVGTCAIVELTNEVIVKEKVVPKVQLFRYKKNLSLEEINEEISKIQIYLSDLLDSRVDFEIYEAEREFVNILIERYSADIEDYIRWEQRHNEYPEATEVWLYMKDTFHWSDEICAGVMGNIMAEIGGGSNEGALAFGEKYKIDRGSGMGMFQWTGNRRKEIKNIYGDFPTIRQQLDFMYNELFGLNGVTKQVNENELKLILEGSTPEKIAYNFAVYFERCHPAYRNARKGYARFAYNYFTE